MGEAKRRKATHTAAFIAPLNVLRPADPFSAQNKNAPKSSGAQKAHLNLVRQECRKNARKSLREARTTTIPAERARALATVLLGTNYALEKHIQDFYATAQDGRQVQARIACARGCTACCHTMVEVNIVEAIAIALTFGGRKEMIAKVAETAPKVAEINPYQRIEQKIPCPLLDKGLCSIHDMRPLKCRALLSFDAKPCNAALGAKPMDQMGIIVPRFGVPALIEPAVTEGVRLACADEGLQYCTVELTGALNIIFSDPTAVDRWFAGEAVFKPFS